MASEKNVKCILVLAAALGLLVSGVAFADYRQSAPGGIVNSFKSNLDAAGIHHPVVTLGAPLMVSATSANQANANAVATIPAVPLKTAYLCGFTMTAGGATGALMVTPTLVGLLSGTMNFTFNAPAGVAVGAAPLIVTFTPCLPASAVNTAIVATLPALGAGNTNATTNAWGYYL